MLKCWLCSDEAIEDSNYCRAHHSNPIVKWDFKQYEEAILKAYGEPGFIGGPTELEENLKHLKSLQTPLAWGAYARDLVNRGISINVIIKSTGLAGSTVHDRLKAAEEMLGEVKKAEEHGKVLGRAGKQQDDREKLMAFGRGSKCQKCDGIVPATTLDPSGICIDCWKEEHNFVEQAQHGKKLQPMCQREGCLALASNNGHCQVHAPECITMSQAEFDKQFRGVIPQAHCKHEGCKALNIENDLCPAHTSPASRGLKLCLEPRCKTWISGKVIGIWAGIRDVEHFCKKHRKNSFEAHPLHDRDGDAIWVGAHFKIVKMHEMEMSHLLNCMTMLEKNAEKREQHTGFPKAKCLEEMPRYALLIAELKQRDACKVCKGGIVRLEYPQVAILDGNSKSELLDDVTKAPTIIYCTCPVGISREATANICERAKKDKSLPVLALMLAFVTALLMGRSIDPACQMGMHLIELVKVRLHAMGVI